MRRLYGRRNRKRNVYSFIVQPLEMSNWHRFRSLMRAGPQFWLAALECVVCVRVSWRVVLKMLANILRIYSDFLMPSNEYYK